MSTRWPQRGLYAITPDEADTDRLLARVEAVLRAGACWLQYRNKGAGAGLRREQALALRPLCRRFDVPLIIEGDWALAVAVGADGAHLGEHDGETKQVRQALGAHAILGASCYDDPHRARAAVAGGASYVSFGAFFPSRIKPQARRASLDLLRDTATLGVPQVAIGGVTPDNARPLVEAGAEFVAAISGVFDTPDPAVATLGYLSCFQTPSS